MFVVFAVGYVENLENRESVGIGLLFQDFFKGKTGGERVGEFWIFWVKVFLFRKCGYSAKPTL